MCSYEARNLEWMFIYKFFVCADSEGSGETVGSLIRLLKMSLAEHTVLDIRNKVSLTGSFLTHNLQQTISNFAPLSKISNKA